MAIVSYLKITFDNFNTSLFEIFLMFYCYVFLKIVQIDLKILIEVIILILVIIVIILILLQRYVYWH